MKMMSTKALASLGANTTSKPNGPVVDSGAVPWISAPLHTEISRLGPDLGDKSTTLELSDDAREGDGGVSSLRRPLVKDRKRFS